MSSVNFKSVKIPQNHSKMKSIVNLSYNKKDTIVPNLIVPVMCEKTYAGDVWNLKLTGFLRWLYLKVPSLDTLKLSLNVFCAEHIDLCQDAQSVLKGSGESEYDDRVEYNFPYITNMLMPYYQVSFNYNGTGGNVGIFYPTHSPAYYKNVVHNTTADLTSDVIPTLIQRGINLYFTILGEQKIVNFPFDTTITTIRGNSSWNALTDDEKVNAFKNNLTLGGRAHIGGLYEKIFGVVGDTPKFVNAEPVIMYYLCIDFYYRAQQHIKPFVGRVKGVDKTIDENTIEYITQHPTINLRRDNTFLALRLLDNSFKFIDGCVCNLWDENQSCLSRFINGNRLSLGTPVLGSNVYDDISSSVLYKLVAYFNGGLCPVLKHPDYFTMATIKPSSADPVPLPNPNLSLVSDGNRMNFTLQGSSLPATGAYYDAKIGYYPSGRANIELNGYPNVNFLYQSGIKLEQSNIPSIVDLRRSALMQTYYEKINANGFLFQDYMLAFFGQDIEDEHLRIPRLIGRASATFDIIPVVQQSGKSSSDGSPLGTLAGNAVANFSTGLMRFSCQMGGFVLANLSISGNNSYQEGYARWCFERSSLDQYNPHFLGIGDQAIMNYELFNPAMCFLTLYYWKSSSGELSRPIPDVGCSASENRYLNDTKDEGFTNGEIYSIVNVSDENFTKAINQPFKGFGFIPRRQELRTAFNRIGGNFKSRSDLIKTLNPSYASAYVLSSVVFDDRRSQFSGDTGILSSIGSLDVWTLSEDYDFEQINTKKSNDANALYLGETPSLNSAFVMSSKPWQRLVEYNDVPPIYMSLNVIAHVVRTITAQSIQGQGVHL